MKCIFVQLPTFEAVRRLDRDLFLSKKDDQQRIVAILLALRELGLIHFNSRDSETWFYFDPKENEADNVIVMKLKKSEMLRSIKLSQRAKRLITNHTHTSQNHRFEIDPFVSQLALWINKEVTDEKPEFKAISLAERLHQICVELRERGVAVCSKAEAVPIWIAAPVIDLRVGGVKVSNSVQFNFSRVANVVLLSQFRAAVTIRSACRLESMLEIEEAAFELCNMGKLKVATIDADGHYQWASIDGEGEGAGGTGDTSEVTDGEAAQ